MGKVHCRRVRFSLEEMGRFATGPLCVFIPPLPQLLFIIYTFLVRWDPNREDDNFFNQSVSLYAAYYNVQIGIHRTFIPTPNKPSPLPFPSLNICTNAAHLCSHVIYIQRKRNNNPPPQIQVPVRSPWLLTTSIY